MNKTLLLLICFLTTVQLGFSQISVSSNTIEQALEVGVDTETSIYITNNSNETRTIRWDRSADFPDGWINFVCDANQCYVPATGTAEFDIAAGEASLLKVTTRATTQELNSMTMTFTDVSNPSDVQIVTINYTVFAVSVEDLDIAQLKVYPNPTSNYFKISNTDGISALEVYNLIGKKVREFATLDSDSRFNIYDLPRGMYLVRLLDEDGEVITTKRISKR